MYHASLELPDELGKRVEDLAHRIGQAPEAVMQEAVEAHLARIAAEDARLDAASATADRGEVVDSDEADAAIEALLAARGVTAEQLVAIQAEVRAEADAFYGVSLCQ